MKQAFEPTGARLRDAFRSLASFYAKRLILVEQLEKNSLNKEIRRSRGIETPAVNRWLTISPRPPAQAQEAVTTTASPSAASTTFNPQACANNRV
jgi:hypothetical protein